MGNVPYFEISGGLALAIALAMAFMKAIWPTLSKFWKPILFGHLAAQVVLLIIFLVRDGWQSVYLWMLLAPFLAQLFAYVCDADALRQSAAEIDQRPLSQK